MELVSFSSGNFSQYLSQAVDLFSCDFKALRQSIPAVPDRMEAPALVQEKLTWLSQHCPGVAAVDEGRLLGYMGWFLIDDFRDTGRRAALSVEWAHAAVQECPLPVYRALYTFAAQQWFEAGCEIHAVTLLAKNPALEQFWFWNGFGLTVVDGIRPIDPLGLPELPGMTIRQAEMEDLARVVEIDAVHCAHYAQAPTLMVPRAPEGEEGMRDWMSQPGNSLWLALAGEETAGMMMFESQGHGAAEIVQSAATVAITGAFTRPQWRGRRVAPALLDAGLRHYQALGSKTCSVDFESLNPDAAAFWVRYFEPVCLSVMRVPERKNTA